MANEEKQLDNELIKTYNHVSNYFNNNKKEIKYIINFFSNISGNFKAFGNKELIQNDFKNTSFSFNNICNDIINEHISLIKKYKIFSENLKLKIIEPLLTYEKKYEKEINNSLNILKEIIDKISLSKQNNNKIYQDKYNNLNISIGIFEKEKDEFLLNILELYLNLCKDDLNKSINNNNQIINKISDLKKSISKENINLLDNNLILDQKFKSNPNQDVIKNSNNIIMNNDNLNNNNFEIINIEEINYEEKFENFFLLLKSQTNLDKNLLKDINDLFQKNKFNFEFYILFLRTFKRTLSTKLNSENDFYDSLFIMKSFSNLVCLTNIMNNIIETIKEYLILKENRNAFLIFEAIVKFGENCVFNNTYMCSLLSKNKIFQNIIIWKNSIFNAIISQINILIKEYDQNKYDINKINYENKNKNLLEIGGLNKYIYNYNKFSEDKIKFINHKLLNEITYNTVKIYLDHFGNYNFILDNPSDINEIIFSDLHIDNQAMINFFIKYYSVAIHSIKKDKSENKDKKIKEKILLIKNRKDDIIQQKYNCNYTSNEAKYLIIKYVSKFLTPKENINLLHLNKNLLLNPIIYKNILRPKKNKKEISIPIRLQIWKACLKYKTYSTVFNYSQLISEINKKEAIESNKNIMEQIMKDLKRTHCKNKESLGPIFNILRCLAYSNDNVNYYQGLNLICLFLYELTFNEEETFTLINNLHCFTPFGDVIENKFQKIDLYCDIIEKLIYLFLPRIFSLFKQNQIRVIYFINSYLFTLFTNVYSSLPENNMKFMFYVWDNFLTKGWNSIFEIILTIFKCLEKHLLSLNNEDVLGFLGNNMRKNEIFYDANFEQFLETKKKFKIDFGLIKLISEEINMEKNILNKNK